MPLSRRTRIRPERCRNAASAAARYRWPIYRWPACCRALPPVVLALVTANGSQAATRLFANTCYEKGGGRIAGYVIAMTDGDPLPSVTLSWSEGALIRPLSGTIVETSRPGDALSFLVTDDRDSAAATVAFQGHFENHRLVGTLTGLPHVGQPESVVLDERSTDLAYHPKDQVGTGYCAPQMD